MTPETAIRDLETAIQRIADEAGPAVVGLGRGWGLGTGVVVASGRVLTTAHNLRGPEHSITFADGRRAAARVAGVDGDLDLATLEVDTDGVEPVDWKPDVSPPGLGSAVVALANPGGRGLRATLGFVSAADRRFRGPGGRRIVGAIEHTAALPRGSSGGPLLDLDGRLLGLNAVRQEGGLILALPADSRLARSAESLWRGELPSRPRLGVAVAPPEVARRLRRAVGLDDRPGVLVRAVRDGTPAQRAGIQAGDLLAAAGERQLDSVDELYRALDDAGVEGSLTLTVLRGGDERQVEVDLDAVPGI